MNDRHQVGSNFIAPAIARGREGSVNNNEHYQPANEAVQMLQQYSDWNGPIYKAVQILHAHLKFKTKALIIGNNVGTRFPY